MVKELEKRLIPSFDQIGFWVWFSVQFGAGSI